MPITWGYARVSTDDQGVGLAAQRQALLRAGVDERHLHTDEGMTGTKFDRPALLALKALMARGDVLVVHKLDRLGRSTIGVLGLLNELRAMGVELKTLTEAIDTTTPTGAFFFTVIAAFAQLERDMISSRTKAALAEIKRTGLGKAGKPVTVGRPSALSMAQIATIKARLMRGERVTHLAREYRVSRTTIYARTGLRLHYVANDDVCLAA